MRFTVLAYCATFILGVVLGIVSAQQFIELAKRDAAEDVWQADWEQREATCIQDSNCDLARFDRSREMAAKEFNIGHSFYLAFRSAVAGVFAIFAFAFTYHLTRVDAEIQARES